MKLLLNNQNVVILSLADDVELEVTLENVNFKVIDKGPEGNLNIEKHHIIPQLNSSNAIVIENVDFAIPDDLIAGKYKFVNNEFSIVSGWKIHHNN